MNLPVSPLRTDLKIIAGWIEPGSRVLDLGCGSGDLLHYLKEQKGVLGVGIDRHENQVAECIAKGLTVLQGDLNVEVLDYPDHAFDYVILSQTLQQVLEPAALLRTLLRVGNRVVVSFPNFSHWQVRLKLLFTGCAPVTKELPYRWYDTPNIRVISLKDFRRFAREVGYAILREAVINSRLEEESSGHVLRILPDWRGTYGIFLIGGKARR